MDYQKAYTLLFNRITDAINVLQEDEPKDIYKALEILKNAQCDTEEMYIRLK